ncbi:PAP2 superfamily protein [Desulfonatronum thiosulfatophilum]|uniref:PAP2 superfamily protein n=1 Tax=Desulfonatronum thiosulfatophilum TaxID=617002 RepID=A0A1G6BRG8_9BACT|nr:phosphatase PAP2 family protein [Desulfonatronum thiosulfatophilum]SDB23234.1 PAP2 superfamily protein [Desulfonatronum thiosulfatophilum]
MPSETTSSSQNFWIWIDRARMFPWFVGSLLAGILLSFPLYHGDLAAVGWAVEVARDSPWITWWTDVSDRSLFQGEPPGAQDVTYVAVIAVLVIYIVSLAPRLTQGWAEIRLWAGYYLCCMLCFLVVNRGLKAFFARVRPGDVLRGDHIFSPMWLLGHYDLPEALSKGSFTSGHTTTAMFLLPVFFIFLHSAYRSFAGPVFVLAVAWGASLGAGRVFSGSHYPGDVLWAMIVCLWICAFTSTHLFSLHRRHGSPASPWLWELRITIFAAFALLGLFLVLIGMKEMIFYGAWYWVAATALAAYFAWTCFEKAAFLARR